jgi:hypothetical protein
MGFEAVWHTVSEQSAHLAIGGRILAPGPRKFPSLVRFLLTIQSVVVQPSSQSTCGLPPVSGEMKPEHYAKPTVKE